MGDSIRRLGGAALAAWMALCPAVPAAARVRAVASVEIIAAPVSPPVPAADAFGTPLRGAAPAVLPGPPLAPPAVMAAAGLPAAVASEADGPDVPSAEAAEPEDVGPTADAASRASAQAAVSASDERRARAIETVETTVAGWDSARPPEVPRARPRAARAAFAAGAVLVGAAAVSFAAPALAPAALAAAKGPALWAGFASLGLSRYWREPGAGVESPRGPPAPPAPSGWFKSLKSVWAAARGAVDSQIPLEERVGGSSAKAWRDWMFGAARAAGFWLPVALAAMVGGRLLSGVFQGVLPPSDEGMVSFEALERGNLGAHMLGYVASSLSAQALTLATFDAARWAARRLGAGKASGLIAAVPALAVSAALVLSVTTAPAVVGPMLGIEAAILWLRSRSNSWLAPLALRGGLSLMTLEFARLGLWLALGTAGTLIGLPAVWAGAAVAGLLIGALAWSAGSLRPSAVWAELRSQLRRVSDVGAAWRAPAADGAPKPPWPLLRLASLWGFVIYALGDVVFTAVQAVAGGVEHVPPILARMLTAPVDLVLANFILVGFVEEFVFRRGLFKALSGRLEAWGLSGRRAFWTAAVVSALIFSGAHYVDLGALLARIGVGAAEPGVGGIYDFSLAGFVTRAVLGVALAWLYAASGTLALPIVAHALADSYEGLGLRWGLIPFLAMAAGSIALQRVRKRGAIQRS